MGYKQVDGTKDILVHENGKLRDGLENLPPDHDRIIYQFDGQGRKRKDIWPVVIIDRIEGEPVKRLLPELVMKEHGTLPRNAACSQGDFESKNGRKDRLTDSAISNLIYTGDAAGSKPYAGKPATEQVKVEDAPPPKEEAPKGQVPQTPSPKSADSTPPQPEEEEVAETDSKDTSSATPTSDLQRGSADLKAKEAIAVISKYDYPELRDADFYTEDSDNPRITVADAWKAKKEAWEEDSE